MCTSLAVFDPSGFFFRSSRILIVCFTKHCVSLSRFKRSNWNWYIVRRIESRGEEGKRRAVRAYTSPNQSRATFFSWDVASRPLSLETLRILFVSVIYIHISARIACIYICVCVRNHSNHEPYISLRWWREWKKRGGLERRIPLPPQLWKSRGEEASRPPVLLRVKW